MVQETLNKEVNCAPCSLHLSSCTSHPAPISLHLQSAHSTLHLEPPTLACLLSFVPCTLHTALYTFYLPPCTFLPKPSSLPCTQEAVGDSRHCPALVSLLAKELGVEPGQIQDLELSLADTQPGN